MLKKYFQPYLYKYEFLMFLLLAMLRLMILYEILLHLVNQNMLFLQLNFHYYCVVLHLLPMK